MCSSDFVKSQTISAVHRLGDSPQEYTPATGIRIVLRRTRSGPGDSFRLSEAPGLRSLACGTADSPAASPPVGASVLAATPAPLLRSQPFPSCLWTYRPIT